MIVEQPWQKDIPRAHNRAELCGQLALNSTRAHSPLGQHLLQSNLITTEALKQALSKQTKQHGKKLGELLLESGALSREDLEIALVEALNVPRVCLGDFDIDSDAIHLVPESLARRYRVMPLMLSTDTLVVAADSILSGETLDALRFATQRRILQTIASSHDIDESINQHFFRLADSPVLQQFEAQLVESEADQVDIKEAEQLAHRQPIVKLVDSMLLNGVQQKASDIHIRPEYRHFELLYRIDGTLVKVREFPKAVLAAIVSRIKILARLNIAERRLPQDGRVRYSVDGKAVDLRISIIPMMCGESVVIRVLNKSQGMRSIHDIGLAGEDEARFIDLLEHSHGIILVTGPTGSGKSTTLYAALQEIHKQNANIITVEDPVEYEMPGVRQIEVHPHIDYTFAKALRSILRHDPDVVMIGEMRDGETCKIAVESALTGHLVLSTLHTNDAASSIVRLMEIGIEPYMIRAALIGVMAQRLVRMNCPHCLEEEKVSPLMRQNLGLHSDEVFYKSKGCDQCHGTGFSGRRAVYELLTMSDMIREHIQPLVSTDVLRTLAIEGGMTPIHLNGLSLARKKLVSAAEIYRSCM
ncbi:GspE/PulE family protein [Chitinivorax sp. B]|uniref:GspE/PulE family protein n=1 Tax=Chitinivorax sp. B TaxID=2502235 RepID=UPI0010F8D978|nr:GspE/PulE family protein [Chitinivorax sp. B]